jgi:hypothetical protein
LARNRKTRRQRRLTSFRNPQGEQSSAYAHALLGSRNQGTKNHEIAIIAALSALALSGCVTAQEMEARVARTIGTASPTAPRPEQAAICNAAW